MFSSIQGKVADAPEVRAVRPNVGLGQAARGAMPATDWRAASFSAIQQAMTKLELSLDVSDRLAREAREAGLLAPEALAAMLESGVRQKAAERIRTARARPGGGAPMTLTELQAIVAQVRNDRN